MSDYQSVGLGRCSIHISGPIDGLCEPSSAGDYRLVVLHDINDNRYEAKVLGDEVESGITGDLRRQLDEADRRAGAAERMLEWEREGSRARRDWLDNAKAEAGYNQSVSFDIIWKTALNALKQERIRDERERRLVLACKQAIETFEANDINVPNTIETLKEAISRTNGEEDE